jgi:hypothetical protein
MFSAYFRELIEYRLQFLIEAALGWDMHIQNSFTPATS